MVTQVATGTRPAVDKLDKLMGNLKTLKNSALLRPLTTLRPERKNATRWYSLFHMLVKWKRIREFVLAIENFEAKTVELIPSHAEHAALNALHLVLRDFESVSQVLQRAGDETLTLYQSRLLFNKLLLTYGDLYELSQLKPDSELVCSPDFENGIIKIQKELSDTNKLFPREKIAVSRYLKTNAVAHAEEEEEEEEEELGFADSVIAETQRAKRRRVEVVEKYVSTIHVLSQSNLCERLFSLAKLILSDRRQSMHPSTLNNLLLLKLNMERWSVKDIQLLLNEIGEDDPDIVLSDDEDDEDDVMELDEEED